MISNLSNLPTIYNPKVLDAQYPANITNYEMSDEGNIISNNQYCKLMHLSKLIPRTTFGQELKIINSITKFAGEQFSSTINFSKDKKTGKVKLSLPDSFLFYAKLISSMNPSLDILKFKPHHTYLVVGNIEILWALCFYLKYVMRFKNWNKSVHFVTDNKLSAAYVNYHYMLPKDNIMVYNNIIEFTKDNTMPKFDFSITNPPYAGDLHLDFLDKLIDITNVEIKMIHPASWLYHQKQNRTTQTINSLKCKLNPYSVDIKLFNGNKTFGIGVFGYCAITSVNKQKKNDGVYIENIESNDIYEYSSIFEINPMFAPEEMFNPLKTKIFNHAKNYSIDDAINDSKNKETPYNINIGLIRGTPNKNGKGHMFMRDFYTLMAEENKTYNQAKVIKQQPIGFIDENEARNALWYLTESKFMQFCLMIIKINQHLARGELNYIPYFDFTKVSSDEQIYTLLGLTKPEIEFIEKTVDDFRQATAK